MGQSGSSPAPKTEPPAPVTPPVTEASEEKPKKRPCCACPETRKARDECIAEYGAEDCELFIQAHKECMRKEGFNI